MPDVTQLTPTSPAVRGREIDDRPPTATLRAIDVITNRAELIERFNADPAQHAYGLADLDDRFWDHSRWWRRDNAVVGRVSLPGPEGFVAIYAITDTEIDATIDLLVDLGSELPDGALVLAPVGAEIAVGASRPIEDLGRHRKMTLDTLVDPPSTAATVPLTIDHLPAIIDLYARAPGAAFFIPSMLDDGVFHGVWSDDSRLIAAAGTHVRSLEHRVAALGGILTDPEHRGRGLAAAVTATVTAELLADGFTVGLNVRADNTVAQRLYQRLGYRFIHDYVEFELLGHADHHG